MGPIHDSPPSLTSDASSARISILTNDERKLLNLHDRVEDLSLSVIALAEIRKLKDGFHGSKGHIQFTTDETAINVEEEERFLHELDQEIEALSHKNRLRDLAMEDVLTTIPINDAVYSTKTVRNCCLLPLLKERDELEHEILKLSDGITAVDENYESLLKTNVEKHADTKDLLAKLSKAKEAQKRSLRKIPQRDREKYDLILQEITHHRRKVAILSDVISMLISESGIDWSSSEELTELMLLCGASNLDTHEQEDIESILASDA